MSLSKIGLFLALIFSLSAKAQLGSKRHEHHHEVFKKPISAQKLQLLLQRFIDSQFEKAFRYIGDKNDFFHGHLLFTDDLPLDKEGRLEPFAILYHTQEDAHEHHLRDPGGPYDYLNPHTRSWVQMIDSQDKQSGPIFNAFQLMFDFFPNDADSHSSLNATKERYTVFTTQLDTNKFPAAYRRNIVGQMQIEFYESNCEPEANPLFILYGIGQISVEIPNQYTPCLNVWSSSGYSPVKPRAEPFTIPNDAIPLDFQETLKLTQ